MTRVLYLLFILSGTAGLIYESIWTRYLGLFVGHDAYAQIIVLVIFLGGMSAGAALVSRWSERMKEPLYGYVAVEFAVGLIGLVFHDVFRGVTGWAYSAVYPSLAGSWALGAAKWSIAGGLILPQSVLLGMTFPLMSAGVLRLSGRAPGRSLSLLYSANSLGAAAGVLIAGFYLVGIAGLPGTLLTAAMLNLAVAAATIGVIVAARNAAIDATATARPPEPSAFETTSPMSAGMVRLLLGVTMGTAVASFIYEIDWIRMLALVLGGATHSFELMLSAFILGLALGAWWIRSRADGVADPLRTLGIVQWVMGALALATLPLYLASFGWVASLMTTFARTELGYLGFTATRYAICLAIMLPATFCAGMTLPLITLTLIRGGRGEHAIGSVYAWNTFGSIVGVVVGSLVLLPLVGLKAMLVIGAGVDMAIGAALLLAAAARSGRGRVLAYGSLAAASTLCGVVLGGVPFEQQLLTSGVYRTGVVDRGSDRMVEFYQDGRTATVSATRSPSIARLTLSTNGKPDASLDGVWYRSCGPATGRDPLVGDESTQALLPLVSLAHAPQARSAAVIGQGSGMSSHLLLGSSRLERLVTIEIEPEMVRGSRIFYPANRRVFDDPRSQFVFDDAKSYFASAHRRFDLILSEPSNPWVSGVSGLFTTEFYARVSRYLTDDGVFGQWLHIYELDDALVLSVLSALHQNFPSYEVFLVAGGDLLIVASNRPALPTPDWSVMQLPGLQGDLCRFRPLTPEVLESLRLIGRRALAPLLETAAQPNSDYYPVLDLGAEKRRYMQRFATGMKALSADWYTLAAVMNGRRTEPGTEAIAALPEIPRVEARSLGARLRSAAALDPLDTTASSQTRAAIFNLRAWRLAMANDQATTDWSLWLQQFGMIDAYRNSGTAGLVDEEIYQAADRYLARHRAPGPVREVVRFRRALAAWNFREAAAAADSLLPVATRDHRWITADELRDGAVVSKLAIGDVEGARRDWGALAAASIRSPEDLRSRLLEAYLRSAEGPEPKVAAAR
jgi:spermidine synthase